MPILFEEQSNNLKHNDKCTLTTNISCSSSLQNKSPGCVGITCTKAHTFKKHIHIFNKKVTILSWYETQETIDIAKTIILVCQHYVGIILQEL